MFELRYDLAKKIFNEAWEIETAHFVTIEMSDAVDSDDGDFRHEVQSGFRSACNAQIAKNRCQSESKLLLPTETHKAVKEMYSALYSVMWLAGAELPSKFYTLWDDYRERAKLVENLLREDLNLNK